MKGLAILVAAGRGERMGAGRPKAFLPLAGQAILLRAALAFEGASAVDAVVVVVPEEELADARAMLKGVPKVVALVAGGARRQDSVRLGMAEAPRGFDGVVLVHDAARPLVEPSLIDAVAHAAASAGAALPVLGLVDTVKRVRGGQVTETLNRSELRLAQTPQGFQFRLLARAYDQAFQDGVELTDEAMAVERLGIGVSLVPGSERNRKITTPEDLRWAEGLVLAEKTPA